LRVFRRTRQEDTYTKPLWSRWDSRRNYIFIAATLLTLGLDIGLAYGIYRIARIFW